MQTIEDWFNNELWPLYPRDLCKNKVGGKKPALDALKKINPDEEERGRIIFHIKEAARQDRKDKDAYRWPFLSTFLNQRRYDDYIQQKEVRETEVRACTVDGCNSPVHGSLFSFCSFHLPHDADRLTRAWKETGLSIRSPTFRHDCIDYCKQRGFFR